MTCAPARFLSAGAALAAALVASPAFADGVAPSKATDAASCPDGQVRDQKSGECRAKRKKRRAKAHAAKRGSQPSATSGADKAAGAPAPQASDSSTESQAGPAVGGGSRRHAEPPGKQLPKLCPEGERLEKVTCIRAPCEPQCVPIQPPGGK